MRPYFAILTRQTGLQRVDCLGRGCQPAPFFSEAGMSSPTPARCCGEYSAITNRMFCEEGLDFRLPPESRFLTVFQLTDGRLAV
jgi:hypothetical protein